jgi:hypothetical protein
MALTLETSACVGKPVEEGERDRVWDWDWANEHGRQKRRRNTIHARRCGPSMAELEEMMWEERGAYSRQAG